MAKRPKENRLKKDKRRFLKRALVLLWLSVATGLLYGGYLTLCDFMGLKELVVYGNRVVSEEEIAEKTGLSKGTSLLKIDGDALRERLLSLGWFESVSIRKEPPWRLVIKVKEKSPVAIAKTPDGPYLVDAQGRFIERVDESITLLPVIDVPLKDRETLISAIKLAETIRENEYFDGRDILIEGRSPETISLVMDGIRIFMGSGNYPRKIERLVKIERVLRKRAIEVEYVDLRFRERAIVRTKGAM